MTTKISTAIRDQLAQTAAGNFYSATLKIYTGAQPASPDDAASGTLLATFTDLAFQGTPSAGTVPLDTGYGTLIVNAAATGDAGWGRLEQPASGYKIDGSVGLSGAQFIVNTTSLTTGGLVALLSCDIVMPGAQ